MWSHVIGQVSLPSAFNLKMLQDQNGYITINSKSNDVKLKKMMHRCTEASKLLIKVNLD